MKSNRCILRVISSNPDECVASMHQFVQILLKEIRKSNPNLAKSIRLKAHSIPNRIGPESLGLSIRFYSDDQSDLHHIENAIKRSKQLKFGLPIFLSCHVINAKKAEAGINVKFGFRPFASSIAVPASHLRGQRSGHRVASRTHHN